MLNGSQRHWARVFRYTHLGDTQTCTGRGTQPLPSGSLGWEHGGFSSLGQSEGPWAMQTEEFGTAGVRDQLEEGELL